AVVGPAPTPAPASTTSETTVTTEPPTTTAPTSTPTPIETYTTGDLVALACPADAGVNHPCRAVYEIGADGKRHAFPHFQVFLTWYSETQLRRTTAGGRVKTIDSAALSSFSLGALMGVRPNSRLVKFISVPVVYAVDASGALRPIPDETTAARWYGANWATKVLDLSDAFFTNYRIGEPLR
ncbi:hypothetical protein HY480_01355, partial [Candidatus Uhrbacteria bacterium]|nr:hypothetical protein [Candidatus Uhrbacteria bacterium]